MDRAQPQEQPQHPHPQRQHHQRTPGSARTRATTPDSSKDRTAQPSGAATAVTTTTPLHQSAHFVPVTPDLVSAFASPSSTLFSPSSTFFSPSPFPVMPSHTRSKSSIDVVRQGKRLSLQFPIQLPTQHGAAGTSSPALSSSPRSRPQSWMAAPNPLASPDPISPDPNLLNIIAAQERYVLELKEELSKAEKDLKTIKKHYALEEAIKQRNDLRKMTKLQPLNTSLANFGADQLDQDASSPFVQREMERRKAIMSAKSSQRGGKVFSGSRHLRALSLLSPDKSYSPSFPQPLDVATEPNTPAIHPATTDQRPAMPSRPLTSPDMAKRPASNANGERYDLASLPIQRDAILRTGKQMANDFKDGLFTFIEDIRQATVGDDAAFANQIASSGPVKDGPTKGQRKPSENRPALNRASSSKKSAPSKVDIGDEFWKEHGLSEPKASSTHAKTHPLKQTRTPQKQGQNQADDFDSWDNWETPKDNAADTPKALVDVNSSDESEAPSSPGSGQASSRTSTRYHARRHDSKASTLTVSSTAPDECSRGESKRNSIPWPELSKLSPSQLKRTASHLMKEWEKNLTPPPEARGLEFGNGDYIGRSASPSEFA